MTTPGQALRRLGCLALALWGCQGRVVVPPSGQTSGEFDSSATTTAVGTSAQPDTTDPDLTSTTGIASSSSSTSAGPDGQDAGCFLCSPDGGSGWSECSIWHQDCPTDQKCSPYSNDAGLSPNAWRCVPVDPGSDGLGAPCTAEAGTGIDSCGLGAMCWDIDPETNEGTCTPHCTGSEQAPVCNDPGRTCTISGDGILALCLPTCDPLDPDACPDGDGCYPVNGTLLCAPDASGKAGAPFSSCEFVNACDPGLLCASARAVGVCPKGAPSCCTSFCDLGAPACPAGTQCVSLFDGGGVSPGNEQVGMCGAP